MADQNQRISDLLDTLTDASSEEIETALRVYEPADIAAVVAERALAGGGGGGGSSSSTQTATVTANAGNGFKVSHAFDLAGPTVYLMTATLLSSVADGETFGSADGDIAFDVATVKAGRTATPDDAESAALNPQSVWILDAPGDDDTLVRFGPTPRWAIVTDVRIISIPSFDVYAGPNAPSITVRLDIDYR